VVTISIYALKELRRFLLKNRSARQVNITLNPAIVDEIFKNKAPLRHLEHTFRAKVNLVANPASHLEDIKII
jgi:hypothetical protein